MIKIKNGWSIVKDLSNSFWIGFNKKRDKEEFFDYCNDTVNEYSLGNISELELKDNIYEYLIENSLKRKNYIFKKKEYELASIEDYNIYLEGIKNSIISNLHMRIGDIKDSKEKELVLSKINHYKNEYKRIRNIRDKIYFKNINYQETLFGNDTSEVYISDMTEKLGLIYSSGINWSHIDNFKSKRDAYLFYKWLKDIKKVDVNKPYDPWREDIIYYSIRYHH